MAVTYGTGETRRVALVCGATGLIGGAVARRLADDGHRVVVHANQRRRDAERLARSLGPDALAVSADLRNPGEVDRMFDDIATAVGPPTALVNAAYPPAPDCLIRDSTVEGALAHHGGFLMTFNVCRRASRDMERMGEGRIVLLSAALSQRVFPGFALFAATAAAVNAFARTLALETGRAGLTVNVIAPGPVLPDASTEAAEAGERGDAAAAVAYASLERLARERAALSSLCAPDDIASFVSYLASPAARAVTGQILFMAAGEPI